MPSPRQYIPRPKPSWFERIKRVLAKIEATHYAVERLLLMSESLASEIGQLKTSVENLTSVDTSAVALLNGLTASLTAALAAAASAGATDAQLADLTALRNSIDTSTADLAAAVKSNTIADPAVAPVPEPVAGVPQEPPPV